MTKPDTNITEATNALRAPLADIRQAMPTNADFKRLHDDLQDRLAAKNIETVRRAVKRSYGSDPSSFGRLRANNYRLADKQIASAMQRLIDPEANLALKSEAVIMLAEAISNMTNHYYLGHQIELAATEMLRIAASHDSSKSFPVIQAFMRDFGAAFSEEDFLKVASVAAEERSRRLGHGITERGGAAIE